MLEGKVDASPILRWEELIDVQLTRSRMTPGHSIELGLLAEEIDCLLGGHSELTHPFPLLVVCQNTHKTTWQWIIGCQLPLKLARTPFNTLVEIVLGLELLTAHRIVSQAGHVDQT